MRKLWLTVWLALMLTAVSACGGVNVDVENGADGAQEGQNQAAEQQIGQTEDAESDRTATEYPLTVKDAMGVEVIVEKAPERIVSTSPSETEILFALGLGDKIVGVSDFDNYPQEALEKPKMGGVSNPNEEAIIAANPDLVIGGISMKEDIAERLRSLGLTLYKTETKTVQEVLDSILQIGVITGTQEQAKAIVAAMEEDIRIVSEAAATVKEADRKKVYIEFAPGWTVGSGEFMDELITIAGGVNIAADMQGWSQINEEKIIQDNPDVIFYAADLVDFDSGKPLEELIKERSGWSSIKAIQEGRLVPLNEDILSRTGPRLTQGLLDISEGLYPGLTQ